jgi:hypothetical protein
MADDFSPMVAGDTLTPLSVQFSYTDGTPINLTGATLSLVLESAGTRKVGAGTWTIDNAAAGQAHYTWQSTDINQAGIWLLQVAITIGGATLHCDVRTLEIEAPL